MNKILSTSTVAAFAATGTCFALAHKYLSPVPTRNISTSLSNSTSLERSKAVSVVHPSGPVVLQDTRRITVSLCDASLSDEEILARFVKGFFGGYALWPEYFMLRALRKNMVHFEGNHELKLETH